jgi:NAD kinase
MRPLVINSDAIIQACTVSRAKTYRISLDGRSYSLPCGSTITIRKAEFPMLVMRRNNDNFAATLRNKLLWGAR